MLNIFDNLFLNFGRNVQNFLILFIYLIDFSLYSILILVSNNIIKYSLSTIIILGKWSGGRGR